MILFLQSFSLALRSHDQFKDSHWSNPPPFYFFFFSFLWSGGATRWRVCYQRGLPRLVWYCVKRQRSICCESWMVISSWRWICVPCRTRLRRQAEPAKEPAAGRYGQDSQGCQWVTTGLSCNCTKKTKVKYVHLYSTVGALYFSS